MAKKIRPASTYARRDSKLRAITDRAIPLIRRDLKSSLKGLSTLVPKDAAKFVSSGDRYGLKAAMNWGHFREVLKAPFQSIGKAREAGAQHGAQQINAAFARAGRTIRFRKEFNPDEPRDEHGRWVGSGGSANVQSHELLTAAINLANTQGGARIEFSSGKVLGIGNAKVRGGMSARGHLRYQYNVAGKTRSREQWLAEAEQQLSAGHHAVIKVFNPDEPRDEHGRWTDGDAPGSPDRQIGEALKQLPALRQAYNHTSGDLKNALGSFITAVRSVGAKRQLSIEGSNVMQGRHHLGPEETHPPGSLEHAMQEHVWVEPHEALRRAVDQLPALERADLGEHTDALRRATDAIKDAARVRRILKSSAIRKDTRFAFNLYDQDLQAQLRQSQDNLIQQLEQDARDAIDSIITAGAEQGLQPDEIMDDIREMIGLTDTQIKAVMNYRSMLESLDPDALDRQLRNFLEDDNVQAAIDSGQDLPSTMIDKLVSDYTDNYLDYRAETIARTESSRAVNAGLQDAYSQAIDRGALTSDAVKQFWRVSLDEVTCPVCLSCADMNPTGVAIDEAFDSIDGPQDAPPDCHPNCRCEIEIVTNLDMVPDDTEEEEAA